MTFEKKSAAKVRGIQCTDCGAPLQLHGGGHRIRVLTCEYCGAEMDVREDYAVLARFSEQVSPFTPLKLGMRGEIDTVCFTVIGMVGWTSDGDAWVDSLLYSETHGYAWMSYQQGHFVFERRVRDLPNAALWTLKAKDNFRARGEVFRFYERYRASIVYVAGELTWVAKLGDVTWLAEGIAPPLLYGAERTERESGYFLGEYFQPKDVYQAFGIPGKPCKRIGVHPAQPLRAGLWRELSRVAWPFAGFASAMVLVLVFFFGGRELLAESVRSSARGVETLSRPFVISDPNKLMKLELETDLSNSWMDVDVALAQAKTGKEVFSFSREISYYSGVDGGESWSEGSRRAVALFKVPAAGDYVLRVSVPEGNFRSRLYARLYEGYVGRRYFVILMVIALLAALSWPLRRLFFEARRWQPVVGEGD